MLAPVMLAPVKLAPVKLAPVKLAPVKLVPVMLGPVMLEHVMLAPVMLVHLIEVHQTGTFDAGTLGIDPRTFQLGSTHTLAPCPPHQVSGHVAEKLLHLHSGDLRPPAPQGNQNANYPMRRRREK
ncbi:unnamed protein product [Boreogadus saida]